MYVDKAKVKNEGEGKEKRREGKAEQEDRRNETLPRSHV